VKITVDRTLSVAALLVAFGSLFVVLQETRITRAIQSETLQPYVNVALMVDDEGAFLVVQNMGFGPAVIEDVRIRHRGRELELDPHDFYLAERGPERAAAASADELEAGDVIRPGDWWLALGFEGDDAGERLTDMLELFAIEGVPTEWYEATKVRPNDAGRASIEVVYASVLGERWRAVSSEAAPVPLD
jgi:hypothetical protein